MSKTHKDQHAATRFSDLPLFLTVEQAAAVLGIGRSHCYELVRVRQIPSIKLGSLIRIPRTALEALEQSAEAPRLRLAK